MLNENNELGLCELSDDEMLGEPKGTPRFLTAADGPAFPIACELRRRRLEIEAETAELLAQVKTVGSA